MKLHERNIAATALELWYSNDISTETYYDITEMIRVFKLKEQPKIYPKAPEGYFEA